MAAKEARTSWFALLKALVLFILLRSAWRVAPSCFMMRAHKIISLLAAFIVKNIKKQSETKIINNRSPSTTLYMFTTPLIVG
jgi:hypothetical protein